MSNLVFAFDFDLLQESRVEVLCVCRKTLQAEGCALFLFQPHLLLLQRSKAIYGTLFGEECGLLVMNNPLGIYNMTNMLFPTRKVVEEIWPSMLTG